MPTTKVASRVVIGLALGMLPGCLPYVISYVHLESPGVAYERAPCKDGAPVAVIFEKSGVRFEVTLEPHALSRLKEPYIGLLAPRGTALSIANPIATITFRDKGRDKSISVRLKAAPPERQHPYVEEMRRKSPLEAYRFVFVDLPPIDSPGTLQLPVVSIDGIAVESPVFTFERRPYAGTVPLNC